MAEDTGMRSLDESVEGRVSKSDIADRCLTLDKLDDNQASRYFYQLTCLAENACPCSKDPHIL